MKLLKQRLICAITFISLGCLMGCGGGGGSSHVAFQAGPYEGSTVLRTEDGENIANCRDYVDAAVGSFYTLYVTEQFFSDQTSEIQIERQLGSGILASIAPGADSAEFGESIDATGFYGSSTVTCQGTRENFIHAETDSVIAVRAQLDLTCVTGDDLEHPFHCSVRQEGDIQAR